jgi:hypothetical protein
MPASRHTGPCLVGVGFPPSGPLEHPPLCAPCQAHELAASAAALTGYGSDAPLSGLDLPCFLRVLARGIAGRVETARARRRFGAYGLRASVGPTPSCQSPDRGAENDSRWALARTRQAPGARTPRTSRPCPWGLAAGVAAVAGGGLYAADAPVCGSTRAEELAAHSTVAGQSLRRADLAQTLREMGLALGWVHHTSTAVSPEGPEILSPGEAPMVTPQPPEAHSLGGPMQVDPTPSPDVDGGIRAVQPTPPAQPHRPHATPPTTPRPACPRRYRSYRAGAPRSAPGRHLPGEPRAPRQHPVGGRSPGQNVATTPRCAATSEPGPLRRPPVRVVFHGGLDAVSAVHGDVGAERPTGRCPRRRRGGSPCGVLPIRRRPSQRARMSTLRVMGCSTLDVPAVAGLGEALGGAGRRRGRWAARSGLARRRPCRCGAGGTRPARWCAPRGATNPPPAMV